MTRARRIGGAFAALAAVVAGLYLAVCALMYFSQDEMLYHPTAPGAGVGPSAEGPPIEVVRIDTADGETLVGWWLPPQAGKPTLLFFNGNAAGLSTQDGRWRRIADQGVGVLAVAYRGYDGSTGRPGEKGLHEDARAAYAWLTARVPARDVVIHGFSLGSGVAVRLAAEHPARALVLEAPYTATVDVAAEAYPWLPVRLLMRDQYRSRDWIGQVRMPVLILHGDADEVIPFRQGQALYAMARSPKRFVRMMGSNHNTITRDGGYDHIWRFLDLPVEGTTAYGAVAAETRIVEQMGQGRASTDAP